MNNELIAGSGGDPSPPDTGGGRRQNDVRSHKEAKTDLSLKLMSSDGSSGPESEADADSESKV